jgi:peptidoglycan/LPS O-acetylase OafA/YrhL
MTAWRGMPVTPIWFSYLRHSPGNIGLISMKMIYGPTYTRLDSLVLGVTIALIKNYQINLWSEIIKRGNLFLMLGILGYFIMAYIYKHLPPNQFISASLSYTLLALSSTLLTLSALSPSSILYKIRIPGAMMLATLSYAIYLTHKSFIHITQTVQSSLNLNYSNSILLASSTIVSIVGAWILYVFVEKPFLKLRDKKSIAG